MIIALSYSEQEISVATQRFRVMMDEEADTEAETPAIGQSDTMDWVIPVPATGPPAFAVLPWPLFMRLRRLASAQDQQANMESGDGIRLHDTATLNALQGLIDDSAFRDHDNSLIQDDDSFGDDESMPLAVMDRLLDGDHPVKVFRNHRGLSQKELAAQTGLNATYLSQIETRKRGGSTRVYRLLAAALNVDIGDLIE